MFIGRGDGIRRGRSSGARRGGMIGGGRWGMGVGLCSLKLSCLPPAFPEMSPRVSGVCLAVLSDTKTWLDPFINFAKEVSPLCAIVSLTPS